VGVWPAAVALFAATLAAELALAPVSASVFGRVGVAGLVLNFIAIPAMALTQFCGMALVCLAPLWPAAAHGCGLASAWATTALVRSADLLLWAPWLSWQTPPVAAAWSAIYYLSLATLAWAATRRVRRMAWLSWSLSALVIVTGGVAWPASSAASLRVTMLDVGQGQAIAVQFPTGQTLLVDAGGGGGSFDVGARVVEPALWALGIRRVDWLAITHGDADHAGGAPSVLRDFHPREIWEGIPVPRDRRMQMLRADAQSSGVVWRRVLAGHAMEVGSVAVDVLGPPAPDWERRDNRNDDSVVIRLRYGDVAVLLTGDVERAAEAVLPLDRVGTLRFVSAPHHGSRTSSTPAFIHRWLPLVAFVSAGRGNSFGHPSSDVLARYSDRGVDVVRTDLDGAITLDTDGRTVTMSTISGRRWRFETVRLTGVGP
jgi:competence protein ComEC